jgi:hypothetical protein
VSPVKYELGFYIPEDEVLHVNRRSERPALSGMESDLLQEPQRPFSAFDVEVCYNITSVACSLRTFEIPSHRSARLFCGTKALRITFQLSVRDCETAIGDTKIT